MRIVVLILSLTLLGFIGSPVQATPELQEVSETGTLNLPTAVRFAQAPQRRGFFASFESMFDSFGSAPSYAPQQYQRQTVWYQTEHQAGTIVIDTGQRFLYHVQEDGTAVRYGVGVGRLGFSWKGTAYVGDKREWPGWTPPASMREREPWLPAHMPGGPDNPLGSRALYLHQGGEDTLYRIHGTNQPETIGQALSSGCIRMLNQDVEYLYEQVARGTKVVVL